MGKAKNVLNRLLGASMGQIKK